MPKHISFEQNNKLLPTEQAVTQTHHHGAKQAIEPNLSDWRQTCNQASRLQKNAYLQHLTSCSISKVRATLMPPRGNHKGRPIQFSQSVHKGTKCKSEQHRSHVTRLWCHSEPQHLLLMRLNLLLRCRDKHSIQAVEKPSLVPSK